MLFHFIFTVSISFLIWFIFIFLVFGSGLIDPGLGSMNESISSILKSSIIMGLLHGTILFLLLQTFREVNLIRNILYSVLATEIILLPGSVISFIRDMKTTHPQTTSHYSNLATLDVLFIFVVFSVICLIPSIIIGISVKLTSNFH